MAASSRQAAPMLRVLSSFALLAAWAQPASAAESELTTYAFWCSAGSPSATAWYDDKVCVMIEAETPGDRDAARMDVIVQFFSDLYSEYEDVTGLKALPKSGPWNGRIVVQVPLDNCGAGGLANHGSLGMSVGVGLFESQYALALENKFLRSGSTSRTATSGSLASTANSTGPWTTTRRTGVGGPWA